LKKKPKAAIGQTRANGSKVPIPAIQDNSPQVRCGSGAVINIIENQP